MYSTKKAIHKTTYKETFRINDSLNRLFQMQLNWWSKDGLFKGNNPIDTQNKIRICKLFKTQKNRDSFFKR